MNRFLELFKYLMSKDCGDEMFLMSMAVMMVMLPACFDAIKPDAQLSGMVIGGILMYVKGKNN